MIKFVILFVIIWWLAYSVGFSEGYFYGKEDCLCELTQNYLNSPFQANPNNLVVDSNLDIVLVDNKK